MAQRSSEHIFDEWLVLRCQGGDAQAFNELFDRWEHRLRSYAYRRLRDHDAALDVAQEAWMAIARGLTSLDDPSAFRSWAYRIVTRRCADWIRRRQRLRRDERARLGDTDPREAHPNAAIGAAEQRVDLQSALAELEGDDLALLHLRYVEAMTVPAIAGALDLPEGTVKSRLHGLRVALRARLDDNMHNHERNL